MWVVPSGWGVPGHHWEEYDSNKVNKAAHTLMTTTNVLNSAARLGGASPEQSQWFTMIFLAGIIAMSMSGVWYFTKRNARKASEFPSVIEMSLPRLRPFSQTNSYTSI
jgi:hypothetical protein